MAYRRGQISVYKGRFHRTLGKVPEADGSLRPKKFLLGTDEGAAEVANHLLEKLWKEVVAEHEDARRFLAEMGGRLGDVNAITGQVDYQRLRRVDHGPVWREESLLIAESLRHGEREIAVEVGGDLEKPSRYVERITHLRKTYTVIAFAPASVALYAVGQRALTSEAKEHVEEAARFCAMAETSLPMVTGQSLHQALDSYAKFARQKNPKEGGAQEAACAARLKASHPDVALEKFGISSLERIAAYWASRPARKATGRPIAMSTVANHLKTARNFIRWLHRTDTFKWSKPVDAEEALRVNVERLRNDEEYANLRNGVKIWNLEELRVLYRYATDQERLLILLGLNCGFAQSEICSLRPDEIVQQGNEKMIKRIRRKSRVYGEFWVWPQTVVALKWFATQRPGGSANQAHVLITQNGNPFDRQRIANTWNRLLDRIQTDFKTFRRLSFKFLRKTAGQLVRDRSDGEVMGVFMCHGTPVATDRLADVYSNRPFNKVHVALRKVHGDLLPMFEAGPNAFSKPQTSESPRVSRGTIELICQLHADGKSTKEVANSVGVTMDTVRRWVRRRALVPS